MKQRDLIKKITQEGAILLRHGGNHDWYRNPLSGVSQPVPRHREIHQFLAQHIIRKLGKNSK